MSGDRRLCAQCAPYFSNLVQKLCKQLNFFLVEFIAMLRLKNEVIVEMTADGQQHRSRQQKKRPTTIATEETSDGKYIRTRISLHFDIAPCVFQAKPPMSMVFFLLFLLTCN